MKFTRRSRVVAAFIALVSMLFMQLAMAAYACPPMQIVPMLNIHAAHAIASNHVDDAGPVAHVADVLDAAMLDHEAMVGCDMAMENEAQPSLCYSPSQLGSQSLAQAAPELPPAIPVLLIPVVGGVDADTLRLISPIAQSDQLLRDTSPPLSIRNCCFRI